MIKIPFDAIQGQVNGSQHITKGLELLESLTSSLVIPNNVIPLISGGAVRDVFFRNATPHDVDIFFVLDDRSMIYHNSWLDDLSNSLYRNILLWLEDQNIEWTSLLLSDDEDIFAQYQGSDERLGFNDIIQFTFDGIVIQLMIPSRVLRISTLSERFPVMCRFFLNQDGLFTTKPAALSQALPHPVVTSDTDFRYVKKKWPNTVYFNYNTVVEMTSDVVYRVLSEDSVSPLHQMNADLETRVWLPGGSQGSKIDSFLRSKFPLLTSDWSSRTASEVTGSNYTQGLVDGDNNNQSVSFSPSLSGNVVNSPSRRESMEEVRSLLAEATRNGVFETPDHPARVTQNRPDSVWFRSNWGTSRGINTGFLSNR